MTDQPKKPTLGSDGEHAAAAAVVAGLPSHSKRLRTHGPNVQAKPQLAGHTEDGEPLIRLPAHDRRMRTQPSLGSKAKPLGASQVPAAPASEGGGRGAVDPDDPAEKITAKKIQTERTTARGLGPPPDGAAHGADARGAGAHGAGAHGADDSGAHSDVPQSSEPVASSSAGHATNRAKDAKGQWLALAAVAAVVAIGSVALWMRRSDGDTRAGPSSATSAPASQGASSQGASSPSASSPSASTPAAVVASTASAASDASSASDASGASDASTAASPASSSTAGPAVSASSKRVLPGTQKPRPKGRPLVIPIEND